MNVFKKILKAPVKVVTAPVHFTKNMVNGAKDGIKVVKAVNHLENAKEEIMDNKQWYASKTLWFNVLTGAANMLGFLPIPEKYAMPAMAVVNILLRLVSNKPLDLPFLK